MTIQALPMTSPLATYCVKCNKGLGAEPVYAARTKFCGKWMMACKKCFNLSTLEEAKRAVAMHFIKYKGCGFCMACQVMQSIQNIEPPGTSDLQKLFKDMFNKGHRN